MELDGGYYEHSPTNLKSQSNKSYYKLNYIQYNTIRMKIQPELHDMENN